MTRLEVLKLERRDENHGSLHCIIRAGSRACAASCAHSRLAAAPSAFAKEVTRYKSIADYSATREREAEGGPYRRDVPLRRWGGDPTWKGAVAAKLRDLHRFSNRQSVGRAV